MNDMLVKGKDVIGLKVVTLDKGEKLENVNEIVYDPQDHYVKALIIDNGGWFSDAKVILYPDIKSLGKDAIIVESDRVVKKASDVQQRIARIVKDDNFLTKNKIVTEDGTELGQVSDILFEPSTGKVRELEVSQGIKNLQSGKKRVKVEDIVKIGTDVTIVKDFVREEMATQAQQQGIQGTVNLAQENAPDFIEQTKQKITELGATAKEKMQEIQKHPKTQEMVQTTKNKTNQLKESAVEKSKKNALGKYVTVNILSSEDVMLAKRGEMITNKLLSQAENKGMLDQVINNVSSEPLNGTQSIPEPKEKVEVDMKVNKSDKGSSQHY